MGTLNFMAPVTGEISGEFGEPRQRNGKKSKHFGVDYRVKGASVRASERGVVVRASFNPRYGFVVVIDHAPRAREYPSMLAIQSIKKMLSALRAIQGPLKDDTTCTSR
ncbi:MAG: M23 family metallopeptidase [Deltaproteobacteria bacterium]|nr:M23 family metallopeptidase [Deltaproteobacteria bacterium]